ncbi:MAG: DUF1015 domain-containing protein [Chloroflexi bacterium]|nr:DUF1015 domain-containing protein [Chloroflexota bacterium]
MRYYSSIGVQIPTTLLPKPELDLHKWAVIACDQFTSQPEYWNEVEQIVGEAPSTLRLILPEVYLEKSDVEQRIATTRATMRQYLAQDILEPKEGFILVERQAGGKTRHGLMLLLDLEQYDYNRGSQSLIRATEGTILDRLPPRMKIREGAALELPHILVLIDDPQRTVIEPLVEQKASLTGLYDFDLMLGSGHLCGYQVSDPDLEKQVVAGLEALSDPAYFQNRYGVGDDKGVLLFAMGDGNHSLATAKAIWEKNKPTVGMQHPSRFALVEIENLHDAGLEFEPIHRVVFNVKEDPAVALLRSFQQDCTIQRVSTEREMVRMVDAQSSGEQCFGLVSPAGFDVVTIRKPTSNLPVGTLQNFLDGWIQEGGAGKVDYVHGLDVVTRLGKEPGNLGVYLPAIQKEDLFKTVILDGALPRKTFSMGEAKEKRFYMECRTIE